MAAPRNNNIYGPMSNNDKSNNKNNNTKPNNTKPNSNNNFVFPQPVFTPQEAAPAGGKRRVKHSKKHRKHGKRYGKSHKRGKNYGKTRSNRNKKY